jgi:hypothetical protein
MPILIVYVTAVMMIVALFPVPDSFRDLLKVLVFGTFGWGAFRNFEPLGPMTLLAIVFTIFAIVFNPVSPVVLPEMASRLLHIGGALLLVAMARRIAA